MGNVDNTPDDWALEAKQYLSSICIGKRVECNIDFIRSLQNNNKLYFATIRLVGDKDDANLSMKVIRNG